MYEIVIDRDLLDEDSNILTLIYQVRGYEDTKYEIEVDLPPEKRVTDNSITYIILLSTIPIGALGLGFLIGIKIIIKI